MAACLIRLVIFGYIIWLYSLVTLGYVWLRTSLHRPFDSPARLASLTHRVTQLLSCTAFMVCRLAGSSVGASNYAVWLRLVTSGYTWLRRLLARLGCKHIHFVRIQNQNNTPVTHNSRP